MAKLLRRSPHFGQHVAHGAKQFFDFAGWEMPEFFTSVADEVKAGRERAILFDGHAMGEVYIRGKDAHKAVQKVCANDIRVEPGRCFYTALCREDGGIVDDLVVFCIAPDDFLLTVAAFNVDKTPGWIEKHILGLDCSMCDLSAGVTCLEVQGPKSRDILRKVVDIELSNAALPYYRFKTATIGGVACTIARLGVTGELGYEIFYDPGHAWRMYDALFDAGKDLGLQLCGNRTVGMFRLEKVYHVYTREIDETTNPFESGLGRYVSFDKGDFIGRAALLEIKEKGPARKLVGYAVEGNPGVVPPGTPIEVKGKPVGKATFAALSPTLGRTVGLGYVPVEHAGLGTELTIVHGSGKLKATVTEFPFFDPRGTRIRV